MKGISPTEKRGPGYAEFTNPGMGMSKIDGGANGQGGSSMEHVHHRPKSEKGTEFSIVAHDGTGLSKEE